jgi:hypothetical protein
VSTPRKAAALLLAIACLAALAVFALWPVCVPIDDEALKSVNVPIEQRTDRDLYLTIFQKRDGRWHQCKTRISRAFFF